jgi:phage-related holin
MAGSQQLQDIAKQLRELQRTSPVDVAGLADWDASARKFSSALGVPLPPQVMHYLHDADIRIKDPEYRASQDEMIAGIISDLESGIVPASTSTTLSFHPRWLGAIALVVLVIIYLAMFR